MERILLRNGIPEPMPRIEGTYLYQTLHVRGRRPLWLDRHTELLARNIQELFGLRWAPDLRRLEAEIAALLDANRHPVAGSSFVRMAFTPAGDLLLIPGAVSLYDGRELRRSLPRIPHLGTRSSLHAGFAGSGDGGQPGGGSGH
mgnify:CR=1 FL=1